MALRRECHLYIDDCILSDDKQSQHPNINMKAELSHFDSAKKDFQGLKKNKEIPPQMEAKLQYLLARIQKRSGMEFPPESLPEYEKSSLDQLNTETGVQLFCNIVNCLSGKDVVLYFRDEKGYLRKDDLFAMWKQCWLTCDSEKIIVRKKVDQKPIEVFEIVKLQLSKNFKEYKKKYVFGACYNKKKKYLIGFQFESTCARIHELLRGLIRERIQRTSKIQEVTEISVSRVLEEQQLSEKTATTPSEQQNCEYDESEVEEYIEIEDSEDLVDENSDKGVVIQFIREQQMAGDSMYKPIKVEDNLRQLVNKNYANKFKTEIILPKPKCLENVLDHYLRMSQWNPEVEECKIKIKISENSYLLQVRVKKYSYLSWPRETVLLATALRYKNNVFLVLRSTGEECVYSDTVGFDWNEVVQLCEADGKVLVVVGTEMDFKGYSGIQDSGRMGLKVIDSLKYFTKFYEAKQISNKSPKLFSLKPTKKLVKRIRKQSRASSTVSGIQGSPSKSNTQEPEERRRKMSGNSDQDISLPDDDSREQKSERVEANKQTQNDRIEDSPENFTVFLPKDETSEISPKLMELLNKKVHERYYLKQKFDQEVHLQPNRFEFSVDPNNHYIFQNGNWKVNEEEDLVFINVKMIELQKDIIKMIIKQLGSNIMSGKSIMNMSLPVEIFDFRSILERVAIGMGYAPKLLIPASETENLIQQAKLVSLFVLGLGSLHMCLAKPFNPILGETFQCRIGGIPLYLEQISHHPPISAIFMKTDNFTVHGSFHSHAQMGLNRLTGKNMNPLFIQFPKTNTYYEIKFSEIEISGLLHGDKKYRSIGKCFIHERNNNRFVEWSAGKDKKKVYQTDKKIKANQIYGGIFTVTPEFSKKFRECENKQKFDGLKPQDVVETHSKISGHWCFDVFFDGVKAKSMESPLPNRVEYCEYVLPSHSNYRADLLFKRMQDLKKSNQQKQIMENIQRRDRKLREGKIKPN